MSMDYEKAYKDALERAKDCYISKQFNELEDTPKEICEYIFPELAESEDERTRRELIEFLNDYRKTHDVPANKAGWIIETISWLEKQKEQKPTEWSEEDERILKRLIRDYDEAVRSDTGGPWGKVFQENLAWLKSLRPQPHWKPSEEQMNMLLAIVNDPNNAGAESCHLAMQSLYNDLKKLM